MKNQFGQARHLLLWIVVSLLLSGRPASAQMVGNATLGGTVADASGALLVDASVLLVSHRTNDARQTSTNDVGAYSLTGVPSGVYTLRASLRGFKTSERTGITIAAGDTLRVDLTLPVGDQSETVIVTAFAEGVATNTGAREFTLGAEQLANIAAVGRSALELLRVLPGVVAPDSTALENVSLSGGANQFDRYTINGVRGSYNAVSLDGTNIVDFGSNSSLALSPNIDMLDELKLQSSNYAAEHGSGAVQISATTRAGTSQFHGTAYYHGRDWRFQANDRSNSILGKEKPQSRYHFPGFSVGGPVLLPGVDFNRGRGRVFFFAGLEYQHQRADNGSTLGTVPTVRQREGDFGENLLGRGQNLNQPTHVAIPGGYPGAGQPAPNNDLTAYVHPLGRALLNLYPLPNYADPVNFYNYAGTLEQRTDRLESVLRVDARVTDATRAFVRLSLQDEEVERPDGIWFGGAIPFPTPAVGRTESRSIAANILSVLRPALTNELLVSYVGFNLDEQFKDPSRLTKTALGAPDVGFFPDASPLVPLVIWTGGQFSSLSSAQPVFAHGTTFQLADKITWISGAHLMKFGASLERGVKRQNWTNDESGSLFVAPWSANTTGNEVADLLTGRPALFTQGTPVTGAGFTFWNIEGFAQDSWRVGRALTLEYGVRLGYLRNTRANEDIGAIFDPAAYDPSSGAYPDGATLNGVKYVSRGDVGRGLTPDRRPYLMPRFNAVWDLSGDGSALLRGGIGRFVNRPEGSPDYQQLRLPPNEYHISIDSFSASGLGNGTGLTFDTLSEINPVERLGAVNTTLQSISPFSVHFPETLSMSVSASRRLPWRQAVEIGYVGTRGRHLQTQRQINAVPAGALSSGELGGVDLSIPVNRVALDWSLVNALRPFQAYGDITYYEFEGRSQYDSLQLTLSRQGGRLQYLAAYTLGKTTGTVNGLINTDDLVNTVDPKRNESVLDSDRRHLLTTSFNAMLPDLPASAPRWLGGLVNGWQLSGVTTYSSGTPIRFAIGGDLSSSGVQQAWFGSPSVGQGGFVQGIVPVYMADPRNAGARALGSRLLNVNTLEIPAFGKVLPVEPPYDLRTPSKWTVDLALSKNVQMGTSKNLQLRIAAFNVFNMAYPTDVNLQLDAQCNVFVDDVPTGTSYTASQVCDPLSGFRFTPQTMQNFGRIELLRGHRIIETSVKFLW